MEIPWSTPAAARVPAGQDIVILGSRFELTSPWRSPAFLGYALRIWLQARRSPGNMGVSLRAQLGLAAGQNFSHHRDGGLRDHHRQSKKSLTLRRLRPRSRIGGRS